MSTTDAVNAAENGIARTRIVAFLGPISSYTHQVGHLTVTHCLDKAAGVRGMRMELTQLGNLGCPTVVYGG